MKNLHGTTKKLIDSKNVLDFEEKIDSNNINQTFNNLLALLDSIIEKIDSNFELYDVGYKILDYLDELIVGREDEKISLKKLVEYKTKIIDKIRNIKKENRNNKQTNFLREVTNRLENMEINLEFNIKSDEIIGNYNIIKYIILNEKNINYTETLVSKYFYLINAYNNIYDNSLIDNVVDEYLKSMQDYASSNRAIDLYYFDNVLESLLNNEKVKIEPEVRERNIEKVIARFNSLKLDKKQRERISCWYNHLIKLIDTNCSRVNLEQLNSMYNVKFYFKTAALEEANVFKFSNKYRMIAKDNCDYIISIDDSSDTIDKDDAIAIKKLDNGCYELKIFIADPNTFFTMDSLLMQEAKKRTQSIYLPNNTIHMFPEELLADSLSLDENKNRYARVYTYIISEDGEVVDFKIDKKVVRVSNNLSYDKVNDIIKKGTENLKLNNTIENLLELKSAINKKYISQDDVDKAINKEKGTSEKLIELFMVFNNYRVAEYFYKHNLPFIYRNHKLNKNLSEFEEEFQRDLDIDIEKFEKIISSIEKVYLSASYSSVLPNHEGLDLEYYSHTTSPLRRYADIIANNCEDLFYFNSPTDEEVRSFEEKLKSDIDHLNAKEYEVFEYYKKYAKYNGKVKVLKR